ncbi:MULTISPECIES: SPOR domain-containing protein [unclassified Nitrosomonas]|uniref:SPOR domain-containing protein n=1 Tax=unclassified Nitrosomonas TaxID=2609265 RepID=UPI00089A06B9|nr:MULTISPECIES: SPOR domain-containing protein [unclassified Nitrosomonas]MDV6343229.1 SPOR domain-containing protein [Nitrosomonas sp. Is37]SDY28464.1 Sporulation related domain-containing protein [Nitrosomonas sp. Nm33]
MSRDYKSKGMATAKSSGSLILGLFIGYALGIASAIGVWALINQAPSPFLTEEKSAKTKPHESIAKNSQNDSVNKEIDQVSANKPRFDFYNILPGIEEPLAEEPFGQGVKQSPPPVTNDASSASNYFLQIGSYKNSGEAERMKAELALLGVIASVQTAESSDKGTRYRVRIGPYAKITEIDQIRASLQENGIEASFVRAPKKTP